jgi:hypothetical protein
LFSSHLPVGRQVSCLVLEKVILIARVSTLKETGLW